MLRSITPSGLCILLFAAAAPARAAPTLVPDYWRYDCTATSVAEQRNLQGGRREFKELATLNLKARFTLFQQPGTEFLTATAMYTLADRLQNQAPAVAGPLQLVRAAGGRGHLDLMLEQAKQIEWDNDRGFSAYGMALAEDAYWGIDETSGDAFYFFLPRFFREHLGPPAFPIEVYVMGGRSRPVRWNKDYRAACTRRGISEEDYVRSRATARYEGPATEKTPWLTVVKRSQLALRGWLPGLSDEEFALAAKASVAAVSAGVVAWKYPEAARALSERLTLRPAASGLVRAAEHSLGKRLLGLAAGWIGAILWFGDLDSAAAKSAEAGGPGYFYTRVGFTRLVNGSEMNFAHQLASDPLIEDFVHEMSGRLPTP